MIVVLDDYEPVSIALVRILRRAGFDAAGFTEPDTAMAAMRPQPPKLLLLDGGEWPLMCGMNVLADVRRDDALSGVRVIVIVDTHEDQLWARQRGAHACLLKPLARDLLSAVERALRAPAAESGLFGRPVEEHR